MNIYTIRYEDLVANFDDYLRSFWLVKPKAANLDVLLDSVRTRAA